MSQGNLQPQGNSGIQTSSILQRDYFNTSIPGQGREHGELIPTLKYFGPEVWYMSLLFTAHWPELVTGLQCNHRGPGSEKLPVTGSKEMEIFGKEHRCSVHTWWLLLSPSQCSPILVFLKLLRGGTFPWDVWTYREQFIADPFTFPSHFGLDWLTVNTQPGVWVSRKVRWVLVLASFCWPPSWHFDQAGGWYHLAGSLARMPLPGQTWLSGKSLHLTMRQEQSPQWWGALEVSYPLRITNQRNLMLISWRKHQSGQQHLPPMTWPPTRLWVPPLAFCPDDLI